MLYDPDVSIQQQQTDKPKITAAMIKKLFLRVGADRGIEYDDDRLNEVAKSILDIVITYELKKRWAAGNPRYTSL